MKYILDKEDTVQLSRFGGKAAALAQLAKSGANIPEWRVIDPAAFYDSIDTDKLEALSLCQNADQIAKILTELEACNNLQLELAQVLKTAFSDKPRLAVRSSAVDEDGSEFSFAGQLESYLYVPHDEILRRVVDVWCSGFTERVLLYRQDAGMDTLPSAPAVLIQQMVNSETAGVAFSADPVTGKRDHCVISAVYGTGSALVSGDSDADTWRVDLQNNIVDFLAAGERQAYVFNKSSEDYLQVQEVTEASAPLSDSQVIQVAKLTRDTTRWFARYQDIEWAFEKDKLYLLQSRPITALSELADPDGVKNIWDNSNIVESYGGITTPLTFSFATRAYESVYREFCRILRVPEAVIGVNDDTFKRMLGLIRGRVYYNILSWYRVLAMLPGFTINHKFMEQMMGVKDGLPEDILQSLETASSSDRLRDLLRLINTCWGLVLSHFLLSRKIDKFYLRLQKALTEDNKLEELEASHLCQHYHDLEQKLLTHWDAPLINDFFAMIFYGVLRKLCLTWCNDSNETLQNDLLTGEGGIISAEPAQRVRKMAELIIDDDQLVDALCDEKKPEILLLIAERDAFSNAYQSYLEKFSDRCVDELKLESITLTDDPLPLLRSIGHLAIRIRQGDMPESGNIESQIRTRAEQKVASELRGHWLRKIIFNWVLKNTRARVRDRENLRFERTRVFGRVRKIFLALGEILSAHGVLNKPRDIFYLQVDEITAYVEGTAVTTELAALVDLRQKEFDAYISQNEPDDRFETSGMVYQGNNYQSKSEEKTILSGDLKGIGCCPGIVRGPVRVITDPRNVVLKAGEILVAERTDPGWIMLFPASSGILVERGSLLSHSAIVAREMGIPAVVSITGITKVLKDGDWVEFDGSSGVIIKIDAPKGEENEE